MADHSYGKKSLAKAEANFERITLARKDVPDPARELAETKERLELVRTKNRVFKEEIADLTKRLEALEADGKEIADAVNTARETIVDRVENVYPRFTEISYAAMEYGAALALGAIKARAGFDFKDLRVIDEDIDDAMIKNSDAMEAAAKQISDAANPHYPIAKACDK